MAKLCARGKAAAKRKFDVYPSAYANMYASAVCSGKVTPGGKKGRTKKADGGFMKTDKHGRKYSYSRPTKNQNSRVRLYKKENRQRKKMREGGMVIEDMTTMIEV